MLLIQPELESLLAIDEDDGNFFFELFEGLDVVEDVDLAPLERITFLELLEFGLEFFAQVAVGLRINDHTRRVHRPAILG